MEARFTFGET